MNCHKYSFGQNPMTTVIFFGVFIAVFLSIFSTVALVTFLEPEVYSSVARIKVERGMDARDTVNQPTAFSDPWFIETEFQVIQSSLILDKVVDNLDLNTVWGNRLYGGYRLKKDEARLLLRNKASLRRERNTALIDIEAKSDDKEEAARIANEIAIVYQQHQRANNQSDKPGMAGVRVEIVDRAEPTLRPSEPNLTLNIGLGALAGTVAGLAAGGFVLFIVGRASLKKPPMII